MGGERAGSSCKQTPGFKRGRLPSIWFGIIGCNHNKDYVISGIRVEQSNGILKY